jgi:TonB family protein
MNLRRCIQSGALLCCAGICFFSGPLASAQQPDLDDLAEALSKGIQKARFKSVVVADFVSKEGDTSSQGQYLAGQFSQRLDHHKKNFVVLDRSRLSDALRQAQLLPKDLAAVDSLQRVGSSVPVDAIVTGTIEMNSTQCALTVSVRNVQAGAVLVSSEKSLPSSSFPDNLPPAISNPPSEDIPMAGKLGITTPACEYCPYPAYTNEARKNKIQGVVVLLVTVTSEGRVGNIKLVKSPDPSLTEKAIQAVNQWRFKPATKDGMPVTVKVPIEVGFHLYK